MTTQTTDAAGLGRGGRMEDRPTLSRWHPDYANAFAAFVKGNMTAVGDPALDPAYRRVRYPSVQAWRPVCTDVG